MDRETDQTAGRAEDVKRSVTSILSTPRATGVGPSAVGVDYLDDAGRPLAECDPPGVERSAHMALTDHEPRINIATITAHFEGDALDHVRVQWHDAEDSSEHELTVSYGA